MSQISLHVHIFFFCRIFFNFRCCRRVMNVNHTIGCLMTIYIHHVKPCNKILQFYMRGCFCHKATSKKLHQGVTKWCSISGSHFQRYDIYLNSQCCNLLSMTDSGPQNVWHLNFPKLEYTFYNCALSSRINFIWTNLSFISKRTSLPNFVPIAW